MEGFNLEFDGVTPKTLDALGEKKALHLLAVGEYGEPGTRSHNIVLAWLQGKNVTRSEENLSISRKALTNSKWATVIAIIAIVLSATTAIGKIISWYSTQ